MSSGVEGEGIIAAAVVLPAAVAFGAGWLAWQGGKLLLEANRAADRQIAEKKRQKEEAARHRKMAAIAAHKQLVDMCGQILGQLENGYASGVVGFAELEQLKYDLRRICEESVPDDAAQIESLTSLGYLKLDRIVRQKSQIAALELSDSEAGLYRGLSVADLMDDLRIAIEAMEIHATAGKNVKAADPAVLEREKLNERFAVVAGKIMQALEFVDYLETTYGLSPEGSAWFHSCFNGMDGLVEALCRPTTSNQELKKGIRRLEAAMEQYDMMASRIEQEAKRKSALYEVYVQAAEALGEKVKSIQMFHSAKEIEAELKYLQEREERAKECAEIYKRLGPAAYLCYAWDQELQAMGYDVHTRKKIAEMANAKPKHARLGEQKMPFYAWNETELTQLYAITEECALQLIVHDDGTVSMQAIAEGNNGDAVAAQRKHCTQLKVLRERLRKNWFILYDYDETETAEKVMTVAGWRSAENFGHSTTSPGMVTDQRTKPKTEKKAKQTQ